MEIQNHKDEVLLIKHEYILYSAIFLNTLVTVINTSMFNVALPTIADRFNLEPSSSSLIVSSYSAVFAIGAILYSKLSNSISVRGLLTFGMLCLGAGSLVGFLSNDFYFLVAGRVIQAAGASSISALGVIITSRYIPFYRRGAAMARIGAAITLGFGLGPLLGGVITQYLGWEKLFAISMISMITIPIYRRILPKEERSFVKFDITGLLLMMGSLFSILLLLSTGKLMFLIGLPLIWLFWKHLGRKRHPFLKPEILKNRRVAHLIAIGFMIFFINFSMMFVTPLLLVKIHSVTSPAKLGLILFPAAIFSSLASVLVGRAVDKYGAEKLILAGIGCMFTAAMIFSSLGFQSIFIVLVAFIIAGSGFVCITTGIPNRLSEVLPTEQVNTGIGTLQLFQYIGGAMGVTVSGIILARFSSINAINPFWNGIGTEYSQAYLFLSFAAVTAGGVFYSLSREISPLKIPHLYK
ncbi:MFS transporter [Mesobacillus harenae]|uniref:MFS transporter n=1 Tax=Mesobacillus harenae TaxID=2213203 RepID=UPI0015809DA3|nr:MFS transporter [Mesobacillus harenae]